MITRIQIKNTESRDFNRAWELYQQSFPEKERRSFEEQQKLIELPYYRYDVLMQNNDFVGFMLWFEFPDMCFIEHMATIPKLRGLGIGKLVIEAFTTSHSKTTLLEVELPISEINRRRIKFYERLDFHYNDYPYFQPALETGGDKVELRLMSHPEKLTPVSINDFVATFHPVIYG